MSRVIVILLVALVFGHSARAAEDENLHDTFARIDEINRASLVMTVETGIVPRALGRTTT